MSGGEETIDPLELTKKIARQVRFAAPFRKEQSNLTAINRMSGDNHHPVLGETCQFRPRHQLECESRITPAECANGWQQADQVAQCTRENYQPPPAFHIGQPARSRCVPISRIADSGLATDKFKAMTEMTDEPKKMKQPAGSLDEHFR